MPGHIDILTKIKKKKSKCLIEETIFSNKPAITTKKN